MSRTKQAQVLVARAKSIVEAAEAEDRPLTDAERREVEDAVTQATSIKKTLEAEGKVAGLTSGFAGGGPDLASAWKAAGFPGRRAVVGPENLKAPTFVGTDDDIAPIRREGVPLGHDERFLAPVFPSQSIGSATSVQVLSQSGRTLAAPGSVQRDLFATTDKAEVGTERTLDTVAVGQLAAVESGVPNAMLSADSALRSLINNDLRLTLLEARDDAIMDAIAAAAPASAGTPGTDLTAQIIFAQAAMAEDGYSGTVVAISPVDYAVLSLLRGADEQFARRDPLAGFRFAVSKSVSTPMLIDPSVAGRRYEGSMAIQAFEEAAGKTNTQLIRAEMNFVFAIERIDAVLEITGGS